ncbi:MAG: 4Fe-4S binding protein [archaeon]
MLRITPYLGISVVLVSIAGLWYPLLGYFLPIVFASLLIISPFRGRWFCGNLCPRGSYHDFWLGKISANRRMPGGLRSLWIRVPIFVAMMSFMITRVVSAHGAINKTGMVFVSMCLTTTLISTLFGIILSPRAWCAFCPMGTIQRFLGANKNILKISDKCTKCGICTKVCPMQLNVSEIRVKPDCIKCGRCVSACPANALSL